MPGIDSARATSVHRRVRDNTLGKSFCLGEKHYRRETEKSGKPPSPWLLASRIPLVEMDR
jgi:hypothetical protein